MSLKNSYDRILKISDDHKQITLPDSRYYRRNGKYYPSITYVLSYFPKGKFFEDWLKKVGYSSEYIVRKASNDGTQTHELCEQYLEGKEINILDGFGNLNYDIQVWRMFLRFVEFWEKHTPKLIETEVHLFSDEFEVAGTCDLICEINGELWLIDLKTSNNVHDSYELQTAIYAKCYEECFGKSIDKVGVLWLKSGSRKGREGKMKGKGWELIENKRSQKDNLELFRTVQVLFNLDNPVLTPLTDTFVTTVQRKV